uniref:Uncharacterized protein n=1 Tax=Anguilla anguilla TaxID=7936 RepID=A0A0E9XBI3_ANGAN
MFNEKLIAYVKVVATVLACKSTHGTSDVAAWYYEQSKGVNKILTFLLYNTWFRLCLKKTPLMNVD